MVDNQPSSCSVQGRSFTIVNTQQLTALITGVGYVLPGEHISSREVEKQVNERSADFYLPTGIIECMSGVEWRYYAPDHYSSSDLAAEAGSNALSKANLDPLDVDLLLFAATTHDISEPATATIVQEKMGCLNAHVFDVKNACNSFLNALDIAQAFITTGRARCILITTGEILSPFIQRTIRDKQEFALAYAGLTLGDGGGACVVQAVERVHRGILSGTFFSDGRHWRHATLMAGGTLMKHDFSKIYFQSDSRELFLLASKHIPPLLNRVLDRLGWDLQRDVKYIIPHQVSLKLLQHLSEQVQFPFERCVVTLNRTGNTAAASIPIALGIAVEENLFRPYDKILLIGGAAGFNVAITPIIW